MFYQSTTITRKWSLVEKQPDIISAPGRNKIGFYGMVNLKNGYLIAERFEVFDQYIFKEFLEIAFTRINEEKVIIILDNAKWHHSKRIQDFTQKHSDKIELLFLLHILLN